MFDFFNSRKDALTFTYNGNLIHSAYDPLKEAEKYTKINLKNLNTDPPLFLLLYPGLDYLYDILSKRFPGARFIIIQSSEKILRKISAKYKAETSLWHPGKKQDLNTFLRNEIRDIDLKGLQILNWPPLSAADPDICRHIDSTVSQIIREFNGNINTTNYFGKRYFKNIIKNALALNKTVSFKKTAKPVFITSSGPSLEKSADLIKNCRDSIFLISLSSSLSFLTEKDIAPDLFLTTDPGFYSTYHSKKGIKKEFPAAAPMTSYHLNLEDKPLLLLNQKSVQENLLLSSFPEKMLYIQQNGTVSGSALNIALLLSDYPVFFCGLDFCSSDLKSHCFPDEFSIPEIASCSRCSSYLNRLYNNYIDNYTYKTGYKNNKTSIQLKTYSSWFDSLKINREIYRINSSEIKINNFKQIDNVKASSLLNKMNTENNLISKTVNKVDKNAVRLSIISSLSSAVKILERCALKELSSDYFCSYDKDILYNYSASVYLDIYSDYISGDRKKALKKYLNLIEECLSFFKLLKEKTEFYE